MKNPAASSGYTFNGKSFKGVHPQNPAVNSSPPQAAHYYGFFRMKK
jgi:hypothetical protein